MHQQSAVPQYSSAQAGGQHYQGQQTLGMMAQGSQGNSMMSQRPMGSYRASQQGRWQPSSWAHMKIDLVTLHLSLLNATVHTNELSGKKVLVLWSAWITMFAAFRSVLDVFYTRCILFLPFLTLLVLRQHLPNNSSALSSLALYSEECWAKQTLISKHQNMSTLLRAVSSVYSFQFHCKWKFGVYIWA